MVLHAQRAVSPDLKHWTIVDKDFLPPPMPIGNAADLPTGECYSVLNWNGWTYIMGGRTGFWMARSIEGPFWEGPDGSWPATKPRWDIYDGLMVPQAAVVWNNRAILSGWVVDHWWGGRLVFRELIQYADGTLGMKWPEEMIPPYGPGLPLQPMDDSARARSIAAPAGEFRCASFNLPKEDAHLLFRFHPAGGAGSFGLNLRASEGYAGGCELRFHPAEGRVQWGTPEKGTLAPRRDLPRCYAEDFGIRNVESLEGEVEVRVILKGWTIDVCINGQRTMITRRHDLTGDRLFVFVESGDLSFDAPM
jgi:hypothetical protein